MVPLSHSVAKRHLLSRIVIPRVNNNVFVFVVLLLFVVVMLSVVVMFMFVGVLFMFVVVALFVCLQLDRPETRIGGSGVESGDDSSVLMVVIVNSGIGYVITRIRSIDM